MSYKLSKLADDDFLSIARYSVKQWGNDTAKRYLKSLNQSFEQLGSNPHQGKPRDTIKSGYFSFNTGNHVIFYKLDNDGCVIIMRILHQRMDFIRHL